MAQEEIWRNYFEVAYFALQGGDQQLAESMFGEAIQVAAGLPAGSTAVTACLAKSLHGLAAALHARGQFAEAMKLLRRAIRLYSIESPLDCNGLACAASLLADLYVREGYDKKALPLLKATGRSIKKVAGSESADLREILRRMAIIYDRHHRFDRAHDHFVRALNC